MSGKPTTDALYVQNSNGSIPLSPHLWSDHKIATVSVLELSVFNLYCISAVQWVYQSPYASTGLHFNVKHPQHHDLCITPTHFTKCVVCSFWSLCAVKLKSSFSYLAPGSLVSIHCWRFSLHVKWALPEPAELASYTGWSEIGYWGQCCSADTMQHPRFCWTNFFCALSLKKKTWDLHVPSWYHNKGKDVSLTSKPSDLTSMLLDSRKVHVAAIAACHGSRGGFLLGSHKL